MESQLYRDSGESQGELLIKKSLVRNLAYADYFSDDFYLSFIISRVAFVLTIDASFGEDSLAYLQNQIDVSWFIKLVNPLLE